MTFADFVKTFWKSDVADMRRDDIGADLINAISTIEKRVSSDVVKSWIDKYKDRGGLKSYTKFFPQRRVNKKEFIGLIRRWTKYNWKDLQQTFKSASLSTIIDCDTEDRETFYLSLYKQFLVTLKIRPREEIGDNNISAEQAHESMENMVHEKEVYEARIPLDLALDILEKRNITSVIYNEFRESYDNSGISDYIQGKKDDEFDIVPFVESIEQDLLNDYQEHLDTKTYMLIVEFCNELKKFDKLPSLYSLTSTLNMSSEKMDKLIAQQRKKLESLYKAIGDANKEYGMFTSYDHAADEVTFKRFSILDK